MIPQFIKNIIDALNHGSHALATLSEGADKLVGSSVEIAEISLRKEREKLLAELEANK